MGAYASLVRRLGHRRWFAALGRRLVPVDRAVHRLTRGRWSLIGRFGVPMLLLTTVGRTSGQPRTTPLLYLRDGDGYVVAGSNWGQAHHPAWTGNLLATPRATLTIRGAAIPVVATLAEGGERERFWHALAGAWPAYNTYAARAGGRKIRVFRLEPTGSPVRDLS